jgi:hypothetical protein
MKTIDQTFHSGVDEFATLDVSDEALESAVGIEAIASFTYAGCTAVTYCPEY